MPCMLGWGIKCRKNGVVKFKLMCKEVFSISFGEKAVRFVLLSVVIEIMLCFNRDGLQHHYGMMHKNIEFK